VRREREHCCDDLAAPLSVNRLAYAHALVALEERRGGAPALAMAATGHRLFARVRRIVDPSTAVDSTLPKGAAMAIVTSVLALTMTGAISVGQAAPAPAGSGARENVATTASATTTVAAIPAPSATATPLTPVVQASGSISGVVTDQTGGRMPGVTITVDPIGHEGPTRTVTTRAAGDFAVTGLPDGAYLLTVSLSGFNHVERRVAVVSGAAVTENVELKVGSLKEAVFVSPDPNGALQPTASSTSSTVAAYLTAAQQATDAGRLAEAEANLRAAIVSLHAAQPPLTRPTTAGAVRIGGDIREPKRLNRVDPIYPAAARAAGIQGKVTIEATVGPDGVVADARVVQGVAGLDDAALTAVRQWVYAPTLLGGVPVSVLMTVTVAFSMR
jgi:TonB family protein